MLKPLTAQLRQRNAFVDQQHGDLVPDGIKHLPVGADEAAVDRLFQYRPADIPDFRQ